jgi:hypothetical protein
MERGRWDENTFGVMHYQGNYGRTWQLILRRLQVLVRENRRGKKINKHKISNYGHYLRKVMTEKGYC